MGWAAKQWVRATKEATYGVFNGSAAAGDVAWFDIVGDDAFTVRAVPQRQVIRTANRGNRRTKQVAARKVVSGNLSTLFYPTQAAFLLDAALGLSSDDLPSYTLDYFDSVQGHRFLGAKVGTLSLPSEAQQDYLPATVSWVAQSREDVTLAQPASTVYPAEDPYEHVESKGLLSIGGEVATKYSSCGVTISNTLSPTWDEDRWITNLYYAGRDIDLAVRKQYITRAMRDAFEAQDVLAVQVAWKRVGGKIATFNLQARNYLSDLGDNLPLGGAGYQSFTVQSFVDSATGTDCSYTVTDDSDD